MSTEKMMSLASGDGGQVRVNDEVVSQVAGLATRDVPGVHSLAPFGSTQAVVNLAHRMLGHEEAKDVGVQLAIDGKKVKVDVRIVAEFGYSIPSVASQIRNNVKLILGELTGLEVVEVNVDVADIFFAEENSEAKPASD